MSDLDSYSDASHGSPYLTTPPPAAREFHRARPRADPSSPGDDYHSARAANSVNESAASTVADDDAGVANEWARRVRSLFPTGELERGRKDDVALAENAIAAMRPDEPRARFAGVEGGGTTWVCAVAEGDPDAIVARAEFPTTTPSETLARVKKWLDARHEEAPFDGLGIATFGPLCLDVASSRYGTITHSPKPGWTRVDVLKRLSSGFDCPVAIDTDVNAPAASELADLKRDAIEAADGDFTAADAMQNLAYVTVGTGVGVGIIIGGEPVHGLVHPEAGHARVARFPGDGEKGAPGAFVGACPYHEDCVEGMCSAAAVAKRCGVAVSELSNVADDDDAWDATAHYVAGLCANLILTTSPQRIVLGGGVLQRRALVSKIRVHVKAQLGGYVKHDMVNTRAGLRELIVSSRRGNDAGVVGALTLAKGAAEKARGRGGGGGGAAATAARRGNGGRRKGWRAHLAHFLVGTVCALVGAKFGVRREERKVDASVGVASAEAAAEEEDASEASESDEE